MELVPVLSNMGIMGMHEDWGLKVVKIWRKVGTVLLYLRELLIVLKILEKEDSLNLKEVSRIIK